jgi:hypothetical protein
MQDYNINVNYNNVGTATKKTNPNHKKTQVSRKTQVRGAEDKHTNSKAVFRRVAAIGLGTATKINQYVGELTENTVTQKRRQVGITAVGFVAVGVYNPVLALAGIAMYVGNSAIQYNITAYKENLSADFLKSLSGGVYSNRK